MTFAKGRTEKNLILRNHGSTTLTIENKIHFQGNSNSAAFCFPKITCIQPNQEVIISIFTKKRRIVQNEVTKAMLVAAIKNTEISYPIILNL